MAEAAAAAAREDWDTALAIWVGYDHAGDARARAEIGRCFVNGLGVPRDTALALEWLTRARAARSKFADRFYIGVRDACTAEQRREAERRASLPLELEEAAP